MFQPSVSLLQPVAPYPNESSAQHERSLFDALKAGSVLWKGTQRRWEREQRRRKVGRAYDMALEIACYVPTGSRLLDVGCGTGFIAHHLSAILGTSVIGIDLAAATEAPIDYRQFDGKNFPVADGAVDAAVLCYVLHHAQDLDAVMSEMRRVLSDAGVAVIYEDIPAAWWDCFLCWMHDLKWRKRTGRCKFRNVTEWRTQFNSAGFEVVTERELSRWRNLAHPVRRRFYLLRAMKTVPVPGTTQKGERGRDMS